MCEKHISNWNFNLWFSHFNGRVNFLFWRIQFNSLFLLIFLLKNDACKIIFYILYYSWKKHVFIFYFKQKFIHLLIVGNFVLPGDVNRLSEPGIDLLGILVTKCTWCLNCKMLSVNYYSDSLLSFFLLQNTWNCLFW